MRESATKEIGVTLRLLIDSLKEKKAYLALFCLAILGAGVVAIAIYKKGTDSMTFEVAGLLVFLGMLAILLSLLDLRGTRKGGTADKIGQAVLSEVGNLAKTIEEIQIPTLGNHRVLDSYLPEKESKKNPTIALFD